MALVTPDSVSEPSRARLRTLFDDVLPVAPLSGVSAANLALIGRPDLHATLTKLHFWSLAYSRVLYLDADTLLLANVDHLFDLPESVTFAAAPELGFPDCFNAGVMLITPDEQTYTDLLDFAKYHESFDGGDQGLLNVFFGDGTRGHPVKELLHKKCDLDATKTPGNKPSSRNWYRLSFTYNMEMHKVYRMYISAVHRYQDEHKILHFIGKDKPWHFPDGKVDDEGDTSAYSKFYIDMVGKWWEIRRSLNT